MPFDHHTSTIHNVTEHFRNDPEVLALLLAGSIAHGLESAESDVDIMIIVSEAHCQERTRTGQTTFNNAALATYPGGFVDGKFLSVAFIRAVAACGSEPARFAFADVRVLFSRLEGLEAEFAPVLVYPVAEKAQRIARFAAQFAAWRWFAGEARKKGNAYLMGVAVSKLILFGGRLILAHNEMLYPFHKWLLAQLGKAPEKPERLMDAINWLSVDSSAENVESFYLMVKEFKVWDSTLNWDRWGARFMKDVELTWMDDKVSVDDL